MDFKNRATYFLFVFFVILNLSSCKQKDDSHNDEQEFIKIFDGTSLKDWEGDPKYWSIKDGALTGIVTPETLLKRNSFIIYKKAQPKNFELKLEYKISEDGNSGINYRSELLSSVPYALRGYQADIDGKNRYTGQNYEEKKRTTLAYRHEKVLINNPSNLSMGGLKEGIKKNAWQFRKVIDTFKTASATPKTDGWNSIHLIVKDNNMRHYVNNELISEVTDNDTLNRSTSGYIGVQVHVGPPMEVSYRNIQLKILK